MEVSNGARTLFWDHKWATSEPLSELNTQPIPLELVGATVEEMWDKDFGWKWEQFAAYMCLDVLKKIQAYELKVDPSIGDLVYWQGTENGKFTIKSSLSLIRNENDSLYEDCWEAIWKALVQQRFRAFLWLVCNERDQENANRFKRKMTTDPKFYVYRVDEETMLHILRDCATTKVTWRKVGGPSLNQDFYSAFLKT